MGLGVREYVKKINGMSIKQVLAELTKLSLDDVNYINKVYVLQQRAQAKIVEKSQRKNVRFDVDKEQARVAALMAIDTRGADAYVQPMIAAVQKEQQRKQDKARAAQEKIGQTLKQDMQFVGQLFGASATEVDREVSAVGRAVQNTAASDALNLALNQIKQRVQRQRGEATARDKTDALTALQRRIGEMSIKSILNLHAKIQPGYTQQDTFRFICKERRTFLRCGPDHGRTHTYRQFMVHIQNRLIERFFEKHPELSALQTTDGSDHSAMHAMLSEMQSGNETAFTTLRRIMPILTAKIDRVGVPRVAALAQIGVISAALQLMDRRGPAEGSRI